MGKKKRRELKVLAENHIRKKKKAEPRFKPKQGLLSQTPRLTMGE